MSLFVNVLLGIKSFYSSANTRIGKFNKTNRTDINLLKENMGKNVNYELTCDRTIFYLPKPNQILHLVNIFIKKYVLLIRICLNSETFIIFT